MSLLIYLTTISLCLTAVLGLYEVKYWNETSDYRIRCAKLKKKFKLPAHYYLFGTIAMISLILVSVCLFMFIVTNSPFLSMVM